MEGKDGIIYNIDGVPAVDWRNEKFLLDFSWDQQRMLDRCMNFGMDIGCIADPAIPAVKMIVVQEVFYPTHLVDWVGGYRYDSDETPTKGLIERDLRRKRTWIDNAVWRACREEWLDLERFKCEIMALSSKKSIIDSLPNAALYSPSFWLSLAYGVVVDEKIFSRIKKSGLTPNSKEADEILSDYVQKKLKKYPDTAEAVEAYFKSVNRAIERFTG